MRREDLFEAIGMVEESRLARCENNMSPSLVTHREDSNMKHGKYSTNTKRHSMPRIWLIAAIIAAMVLMMGCAWVIHLTIAESPLFDYPLTESANVEPERIHLSVSDVTSTSMQITCSIDGLVQDKDAIYILRNGPFTLEMQTESGWEMLPERISDPLRDPDEVLTDGSLDWYVDWSAVYGILEPGVYRFTTTILEGNVPVSTTFSLEANTTQSEIGAELAKIASEILDRDYYYVRFYEMFEFGSFEMHSAAANGRWCGDQRPPCGLKTAG